MTSKQPLTHYLTTRDVTNYLSISSRHAKFLMQTSKIKASNVGFWRTTEQDLINYIEGNK